MEESEPSEGRWADVTFTDEISCTNFNPQSLERYLANPVEGLGFCHSIAVFALLEDAFAFVALGNLPGAPTVDLTKSSIAAAPSVPSRNNGSSSNSSSSSSSCMG